MKYYIYIYIYINYLKKKHVDWIPCYFSHIPLNFSSCLALNKCEPAYPLSPHWVQAKDLTDSLLHPNQKKNHIPHQFHAINTNTNQKRKKKEKEKALTALSHSTGSPISKLQQWRPMPSSPRNPHRASTRRAPGFGSTRSCSPCNTELSL